MGFTAILPKRGIKSAAAKDSLDKFLDLLGKKTVAKVQKYPAAKPWTSPPPKTGPRAGGKRTGNLGRSWTSSVSSLKDVTVTNKVSYAPYVQGDKETQQTSVMAGRGWLSVTDAAKEALRETKAEAKMEASGPF